MVCKRLQCPAKSPSEPLAPNCLFQADSCGCNVSQGFGWPQAGNARTVNLGVTVLRNVLRRAIDDGWIKRLPNENLRPLKWVGHQDGGILIGKVYGHLSNEHAQIQAQRVRFGPEVIAAIS